MPAISAFIRNLFVLYFLFPPASASRHFSPVALISLRGLFPRIIFDLIKTDFLPLIQFYIQQYLTLRLLDYLSGSDYNPSGE